MSYPTEFTASYSTLSAVHHPRWPPAPVPQHDHCAAGCFHRLDFGFYFVHPDNLSWEPPRSDMYHMLVLVVASWPLPSPSQYTHPLHSGSHVYSCPCRPSHSPDYSSDYSPSSLPRLSIQAGQMFAGEIAQEELLAAQWPVSTIWEPEHIALVSRGLSFLISSRSDAQEHMLRQPWIVAWVVRDWQIRHHNLVLFSILADHI